MAGSPALVHWRRNRTFALFASLSVALLGGVASAGWLFHSETLKSIIPGAAPMKPNMAVGMLLCGGALALLSRKKVAIPIRICAAAMGAAVIVLAALTLGEHLFDWDFAIEEWPIGGIPGALGTSHPGRVSPATALCFLVAASALCTKSGPIRTRFHLSIVAGLSGALVVIGALALAGFCLEIFFGPRWNYVGTNVTGILGAVGFILLGSGLLVLLQSKNGLTWSLDGSATAGFAFGTVLMVVAAATAVNYTKQMLDTTSRVAHREELLRKIQEITRGMADLASSERIYIITGNEQFLKERAQTNTDLNWNLLDFKRLTSGNPIQHRIFDQLQALVIQRIDSEERMIAARRQGSLSPEMETVAEGPALKLSADTNALLTRLQSEEYRLLGLDRKRAETATTTAFLVLPMGVFLSLIILSVGLFYLNSGVGERKCAEAALRQAEAKYRSIFENAVEGVFQTTPEGGYISVNPALARMYGYGSPEELMASVNDIGHFVYVDPDRRTQFKRLIEAEGFVERFEYEVYRKDGRRIWLSENARAVRNANGVVIYYEGTVENITERKQVEDALRASEAYLQTVVENLDEGVIVSDLTGGLLHWNRAALQIHGYRDLEQGLRSLTDFVDTFELTTLDGRPVSVEEWPLSRVLRGENLGDLELCVRNIKADWERIFNYGGTLVHDGNNQPLLAIVTVTDITERKRTQERLLEQSDIINRAQDAIIIRRFEDEAISFWNKGAEHLYGWSANEALGKPIGELIFADERDREAPLKQLVSTGEFHGELKQVAKDGREIIVESRATLVRNTDGEPRSVLLINTDVTEQKKLETQLLRAQRLESIGTLASGVAHDLNNILTPIIVASHALRGSVSTPESASCVSMIEECGRRGAEIVKQVLTFARGVEGERVTINSRHLIDEVADITRKTFPKSIEIRSGSLGDLWPIQADPTQLHQVLLNLAVNARDAMSNGGSLTFAAENFTLDEHYAAMAPDAKAGPYVVLSVSDSGSGMPRATVDKIFDPFFTTKEVGKGTGLGLSTALGIVKSHNGFISVYSELGKGTTFKIFLPAKVSEEAFQKSKTAVAPVEGNGEQILVVDDEENILRITKMIFEKHNYRVLSASDGPEALALFAQQMQSIRVALTDIAMPYMDGVALVRALRKMKSDLPIIASTGQGDQPGIAELESLGVKNFLTKPYNTEKLLATVHDTLQGRESVV